MTAIIQTEKMMRILLCSFGSPSSLATPIQYLRTRTDRTVHLVGVTKKILEEDLEGRKEEDEVGVIIDV